MSEKLRKNTIPQQQMHAFQGPTDITEENRIWGLRRFSQDGWKWLEIPIQATGPPIQATGPPMRMQGVGIGLLKGDSKS